GAHSRHHKELVSSRVVFCCLHIKNRPDLSAHSVQYLHLSVLNKHLTRSIPVATGKLTLHAVYLYSNEMDQRAWQEKLIRNPCTSSRCFVVEQKKNVRNYWDGRLNIVTSSTLVETNSAWPSANKDVRGT
ncbi:unnamed protein product, partial [Ectocarpus sp. 4 AP-2014]